MTLTLPTEGATNWDDLLNPVLRALDRRTDRVFTPWEYGAVGDGIADDTEAINAAVDDAQDHDGLLFVNGRFGFAAEVFFKGGVPIVASGSARATTTPTPEPGLVAIDPAAIVRWGKWSGDNANSINDNPGPIKGLVIDGDGIGGASDALFRSECAQGTLIDLIVRNSAGDNINWASSQNVNVWNLQTQFAAGYAHNFIGYQAGAQPPGHIQFFGGHHGDSYGTIRLTSHDNTFFVGPHDITFYGPIIEGGRVIGQDFKHHILLEDGRLTLVNPTITIGANVADIEDDAVIVIKNTIRPTASTILVMNDPDIGGGAGTEKATDLIRIEGGNALNEVRIHGVPQLANASYGINFKTGPAIVSIDHRPRYVTAFTALTRSTSGGDNTGMLKRTNTPLRYEIPADSSVSAIQVREEGKAANALQVAKNGEIRILDPDTGASLGTIAPVAGGGLLLNGPTGGQGNVLHVAKYTTAGRPGAAGLPYRLILDTDQNTLFWSDGTRWVPTDQWNQVKSDRITTGQEVIPRGSVATTTSMATGTLRLTYFTAYQDMTVASLVSATGGTAAGATPTLCKMGLYSVAANGDLTRIGITANDTALWNAANTKFTKALTATVAVTAGQRYAAAQLCVTAATAPVLAARTVSQAIGNDNNRVMGALGSQSDIPASITAATVNTAGVQVYGELVP